MSFITVTTKFEGPLDLMLHLIKEKELDIFDLDMDVLLSQYLEYLDKMEELELEIESEYLVELATLIEYKSKKLLPKNDVEIDSEYEEDPKERLVKRLLEYQKYKEVSKTLDEAYLDRQRLYAKPISNADNYINRECEETYEGNPNDLLKAMRRVLLRRQLSRPIETKYTRKEISIDDRILQIKSRLKDLPDCFNFETIIDDCESKHEYIVTFLAILDLAKNHILYFEVDDNDAIWFSRKEF